MRRSSTAAEVCQSIRRSIRKPPLNHDLNRCAEVAIDARAFRVRPQRRDEMAAHLDEGRRACRGQVQATEEFLARRFGSRLQPQERVGGWLASVGLSRSRDLFRIGQERIAQHIEERVTRGRVQRSI